MDLSPVWNEGNMSGMEEVMEHGMTEAPCTNTGVEEDENTRGRRVAVWRPGGAGTTPPGMKDKHLNTQVRCQQFIPKLPVPARPHTHNYYISYKNYNPIYNVALTLKLL